MQNRAEWRAFGGTFRDFVGAGLCVPGVQIRAGGGGTHLVGDINEVGGVCDDCKGVRPGDVVEAYRVLLGEEDLA